MLDGIVRYVVGLKNASLGTSSSAIGRFLDRTGSMAPGNDNIDLSLCGLDGCRFVGTILIEDSIVILINNMCVYTYQLLCMLAL